VDLSVRAFIQPTHTSLLIDPDRGRDVQEVVQGTDRVLRVDQANIRNTRPFIPGTGGLEPLSVLGNRNDDEVFVVEFGKNCLPT
jgi:hypothetical protein